MVYIFIETITFDEQSQEVLGVEVKGNSKYDEINYLLCIL